MDYINNLLKSGSTFTKDELNLFKQKINFYKKINYEKTKDILIDELINDINNFSKNAKLNNISLSLVYNNNYLNIYDKTNINYDIASITKLFTLLLSLKLNELNLIDLNDLITNIDKNYINLNNHKLIDLINMKDELITKVRLINSSNIQKELYNTYIKKIDYKYTDIGFIILTKLLEKKLNLKYEDILYKYLLKENNLLNTYYDSKKVNDPKANKLGVIASAGLFTCNYDLYLLYNNLNNYLSESSINMLYKNSNIHPKLGPLYQKYSDITKTYVLPLYSNKTFASEGYTGCLTISDLYNKLHTSILVDSINKETNIKDINYSKYFNNYQYNLLNNLLLLDYLSKYNDEKNTKKLIKI